MSPTVTIAAVQACPVYLDREATIAKACRLIAEVGAAGGHLAVFPEAFVPAQTSVVSFARAAGVTWEFLKSPSLIASCSVT